ncbi:hypothetical protein ACJ41O_012767 [Fusarium nematophilum]
MADGVGYWAEARIFGGVVLFDRRNDSSDAGSESHDVYLHADRSEVTYRIFKILAEQKHELTKFDSDVTPPPECLLPIIGDLKNRERVDPEEPIESTSIYRDKWNRKEPSEDGWDRRRRDVIDDIDYISWDEWATAKTRASSPARKIMSSKPLV